MAETGSGSLHLRHSRTAALAVLGAALAACVHRPAGAHRDVPAAPAATIRERADTAIEATVDASAVDPAAPRRLIAHAGGVEFVWLADGVVCRTRDGRTTRLGVLVPRGRVLHFDATRDAYGVYHVAAVVHVDERVTIVAGRFDGTHERVASIRSTPTVGGFDTQGDGVFPYPRPERYASVQVAADAAQETRVVWTTDLGAEAGVLHADGQTSVVPAEWVADRGAHSTAPDALRRFVPNDQPFRWSTIVQRGRERWIVGVSRYGTLHAMPAGEAAPQDPQETRVVPLLGLFALPDPATGFDAVMLGDDLVLAWSAPAGVAVRRIPLGGDAASAPSFQTLPMRAEQVQLANGAVFGEVHEYPHTGAFASVSVSVDPMCVLPLVADLRASPSTLVLASNGFARLLHATDDAWSLETYVLQAPLVGAPGQTLVPPSGWVHQTFSEACPGRQAAYPRPRRSQRLTVPLAPGARWVDADDRGAFAVQGNRLLRVRWEAPAVIEAVAGLPADVDPFSVRVQGGVVTYGLAREDTIVTGARRVRADRGAFALTDDGTLVVRREDTLYAGDRAVGATDFLPVAARTRRDGTFEVVLRTASGAFVLATFDPQGRAVAALADGPCPGESVARFAGDHLLVGCPR